MEVRVGESCFWDQIWPAFSLLSGRAATGGAPLNLEARAFAAVSGIKVEMRGEGSYLDKRNGAVHSAAAILEAERRTSGVPAAKIRRVAESYAKAKPAAIFCNA